MNTIPFDRPPLRVADHRRHVGTRPRARRGAARARRAVAFVARDARAVADVARRASRASTASSPTSRARTTIHRIALQINAALGGLDVLVNNASSLGPVPLRLLADTDCEDLERALATNLLGPFRLTKALLGALAASPRASGRGARRRRQHQRAMPRVTPYPGWGAYGASKAALRHLSRIWDEELRALGVRVHRRRPGRHGHAAACARRPRRRPGDAEAAARCSARDASPSIASAALAGRSASATHRSHRGAPREGARRHRSSGRGDATAARRSPPTAAAARAARASAPRRIFAPRRSVIANDAATLPASLGGVHLRERRADRGPPRGPAVARSARRRAGSRAIVFGAATTARRPRTAPRRRRCAPGDAFALGPLRRPSRSGSVSRG